MNKKGDLTDAYPVLAWAIEEAAKINDLEAQKVPQFDGSKFIDYMLEKEADWSYCLEDNKCSQLVNDFNDNKVDSGLFGINFAKVFLNIQTMEKTPGMKANNWIYGIKSLLYIALEIFESQELQVQMWNGVDAAKFMRFLFKYAHFIDQTLKSGEVKTFARLLYQYQDQFMAEDNRLDLIELEERVSVWINSYDLLKQPCDSLNSAKNTVKSWIKWNTLHSLIDKMVKINLNLCDVQPTQVIASL